MSSDVTCMMMHVHVVCMYVCMHAYVCMYVGESKADSDSKSLSRWWAATFGPLRAANALRASWVLVRVLVRECAFARCVCLIRSRELLESPF